jgi:hypothetical protein
MNAHYLQELQVHFYVNMLLGLIEWWCNLEVVTWFHLLSYSTSSYVLKFLLWTDYLSLKWMQYWNFRKISVI